MVSFLEAVNFEQVYLVFIITKLATVVVHSNYCALAFHWVRIILHFIMRLTPEQRLQIVQLYYENHVSVLFDSFMVLIIVLQKDLLGRQ